MQTVGLSIRGCRGDAGAGWGRVAGGPVLFEAAGRLSRLALGEAFGVVPFFGGKSPKGELGGGEGGELGDVFDGEAEAVIGGGAHGDRDGDRDVEDRDDEREAGGFAFLGDDEKDRGRSKQLVRFTPIVGADRDQAGLRIGRAFVESEVRGAALSDRAGVAEDSGRRVEDDVLGRFRSTGAFQGKGGREVGVGAGLGARDDNGGRGHDRAGDGAGNPDQISTADIAQGRWVRFFAGHRPRPAIGGRGGDFHAVDGPFARFDREAFAEGFALEDADRRGFAKRRAGFDEGGVEGFHPLFCAGGASEGQRKRARRSRDKAEVQAAADGAHL